MIGRSNQSGSFDGVLASRGRAANGIDRSKPRVLHVIESTVGGTLTFLDTIITATAGLPFQFGLAYSTLRCAPLLDTVLEKARVLGWQTFQIEMTREVSPGRDSRSLFKLLRLYWRFKPEIVHCHSSKAGALGRIAGALNPFDRPLVVYQPHAVAVQLGKRYLVAEKLLVPLTARMLPVTESEAKQLLTLKLTSTNRYTVLAPAIDCRKFAVSNKQQARLNLGLDPAMPIMVGIGRMVPQKNPLFFVTILKRVLEQIPEVHGIWIGDGDLRQEVCHLARQQNIEDRLTITGWQDDVRPWLAAADLLVSSSEYESFGYMVAEALAMERPVVATDITGTSDIMTGELAAFLYPRGDATLAAGLVCILLRYPDLALRCGRVGRKIVDERFSFETLRSSLEDLYSHLSSSPVQRAAGQAAT